MVNHLREDEFKLLYLINKIASELSSNLERKIRISSR